MIKKHFMINLICLLIVVFALNGCNKNNKNALIPVQMTEGDYWSIIDENGKEVVKEEYPEDARISVVYNGVYWVRMDGKYQLYSIKSPKKPISDEEYTNATYFNAGVALASKPNSPICIIDTRGNCITLSKDIVICRGFTGEEGYAKFENQKGLKGVLNTKGKIVVEPRYEALGIPCDGLVIAKKEKSDKIAIVLNMQGKKQGEINLNKYYLLNDWFHEGKIIVANNKNENLIVLDKTGKELYEIKNAGDIYSIVHSDHTILDGYMEYVNANGRWGLVDNNGQKIIRPKYQGIINLGDGFFGVYKNHKLGIINHKDEVIVDFKFESCKGMVGDKFIMEDKNSYVLLGKNGKEITSFYNFDIAWEPYAIYVDEQTSSVSNIKDLDDWDNENFNGNRRGVETVEDDDYIAVDTVVADPEW